jgi:hypothetical protein
MESDELFEVQPVGAVAPEQRSTARQPNAAIPNFRFKRDGALDAGVGGETRRKIFKSPSGAPKIFKGLGIRGDAHRAKSSGRMAEVSSLKRAWQENYSAPRFGTGAGRHGRRNLLSSCLYCNHR